MKIKFNIIIPSAGKNTRMQTSNPKSLSIIKNKINLENLFEVFKNYSNKFYVSISNKEGVLDIYKKNLNTNIFNKIFFAYSNSGSGDGQAILDTLNSFNIINKNKYMIVCWGDVYINNSKTIENLIRNSVQYLSKFDCIIPLFKTDNPYVNFVIDNNNKIKKIKFSKKGEFSKKGNSDYGIFLLNSNKTYMYLNKYVTLKKKNRELNLLDFLLYAQNNFSFKILPLINKKYDIFSYNSKMELRKINNIKF